MSFTPKTPQTSQGRQFSATSARLRGRSSQGPHRYPQIQQRGFYSDILPHQAERNLGNVLSGPQTQQDTLWNIGKEKHTPKEVAEIEKAIESLIQELQGVGQGNDDSDKEAEAKNQNEEKNDWSAVRRVLWRHLELQDGDPDIPPGALAMLIRVVGANTVAGEVLQTILEAALERQGEGGTEGPSVGAEGAQ